MVKIMMHGCNGVMGQVISKIVEETEGAVMACGVDRVDDGHNDYPVFTDINACDIEVDAIIDFSAAPAVDGLLPDSRFHQEGTGPHRRPVGCLRKVTLVPARHYSGRRPESG